MLPDRKLHSNQKTPIDIRPRMLDTHPYVAWERGASSARCGAGARRASYGYRCEPAAGPPVMAAGVCAAPVELRSTAPDLCVPVDRAPSVVDRAADRGAGGAAGVRRREVQGRSP